MGANESTFSCAVKGSAPRLTLQWLADHPTIKDKKPVRGYLASSVAGWRVYRRHGGYAFALLVMDEFTAQAMHKFLYLISQAIKEGYREQLGIELTYVSIDVYKS